MGQYRSSYSLTQIFFGGIMFDLLTASDAIARRFFSLAARDFKVLAFCFYAIRYRNDRDLTFKMKEMSEALGVGQASLKKSLRVLAEEGFLQMADYSRANGFTYKVVAPENWSSGSINLDDAKIEISKLISEKKAPNVDVAKVIKSEIDQTFVESTPKSAAPKDAPETSLKPAESKEAPETSLKPAAPKEASPKPATPSEAPKSASNDVRSKLVQNPILVGILFRVVTKIQDATTRTQEQKALNLLLEHVDANEIVDAMKMRPAQELEKFSNLLAHFATKIAGQIAAKEVNQTVRL